MSRILAAMMVTAWSAGAAFGQEYINGYTYVAPSYYLAPPVITYTSPFPPLVVYAPPPVVVAPRPVLVPPPVVYANVTPVVASTPVVTTYPAPVPVYRERLKTSRREVEYTAKGYNPYTGRKEKVEVEWNRRGVEIEAKRR